ncbi:MAG: dynamin family protein [Deltaproteobacteria bacterium]|nr:dynamin family protein [Deltaproteobacteria bacterium]
MSIESGTINHKKLNKIEEIARDIKLNFILRDVGEISERLLKGGFNIVFLGQFKRGKSSLINAFLGENILPYGLVPVTAVVSVIRYAEERYCILKTLDGTEQKIELGDIYLYATQEENPDNVKNVAYLDIRLPNEYLKRGLFIVDTPGISSVFESNTMVTKGFIQNIDTAVIVLGSDPPVSYDELQIIRQIKGKVKELVYVINKADKESPENLITIRKFTSDILRKELKEENAVIYCLSSKDRLEGRITYDWEKFNERIENMLYHKSEIISVSFNNAVDRLSKQLISEIDRYISVLKKPLDETRHQSVVLESFRKESEIFLRELSYRFQAEQDRISQLIDIEQKKFIENMRKEIDEEFERLFRGFLEGPSMGREYYYNQMHSIAEKYVFMCIEEIKSFSDRLYAEFMERYKDELVKMIRRIEGIVNLSEFSELLKGFDTSMSIRSDFYFHHFMRYTSSSPLNFLINLLLPSGVRIKRMKTELKDYLDWLIYANCSRYNGDVSQRIIESRRKTEADLRKMITDIVERTNEAINYAEAIVKEGEGRIKSEVDRLIQLKTEVLNLSCDSVINSET